MSVLRVEARRREAGRIPWSTAPTGFRVLVPGWPQWHWGQHRRGVVLFGSYLSAAAMSAFAWGTPIGLGILTFAFATHLVSLADALRQSAFPWLGRAAALGASAAILVFGVYAPLLVTAATTAWPGMRGGTTSEGYLINRLAYRDRDPKRDDLVWYRASPSSEPRLGQVVAGSGQEVHWSENRLQVDGVSMKQFGTPFRSTWPPPKEVAYRIPDRHLLILPEGSSTHPQASEGLLIVATDQVVGRAWAKYYPVRERRLLSPS
jgi:hypothetical protein